MTIPQQNLGPSYVSNAGTVAATADTTNGCLNISFTPPTSNTDTWNVVGYVQTVETQ